MRYPGNVVTREDTRSEGAGVPEKCFYCSGKLGAEHDADCVTLHRPVKIRVTMDIIVPAVRSWDKHMIEFRFNESTWCADNIMDDLQRYTKGAGGCLCGHTEIEYLGDATLEEAVTDGLQPDTPIG